jgi:propionate CoA-transferase
MLSLSIQPGSGIRSFRHWKIVSPDAAAGLICAGSTLAVGWLGDGLAKALAARFLARRQSFDLTIVYAATQGLDRTHGLNRLAHEGLVRRVIGGQWHPVPGLHALALADRIEAYSLPTGVINRLFRDIAEGLTSHLTRVGLGTFIDPRHGGGRLNQRTQEDIVHLVHTAGEEVLLVRGFALDIGLIGVGFMAETGAIAMTRDALAIARAVRRTGGIVIAQTDKIGTHVRLPSGQVEVSDTLVDILVTAGPRDTGWETFAPNRRMEQSRLAH